MKSTLVTKRLKARGEEASSNQKGTPGFCSPVVFLHIPCPYRTLGSSLAPNVKANLDTPGSLAPLQPPASFKKKQKAHPKKEGTL